MKIVDGLTYMSNDIEWSKAVNAKNDGFCLACSNTSTAAHLISRRFKNTRPVLENGVPLCIEHHREFDSLSIDGRDKTAALLVGGIYNKLKVLAKEGLEVVDGGEW